MSYRRNLERQKGLRVSSLLVFVFGKLRMRVARAHCVCAWRLRFGEEQRRRGGKRERVNDASAQLLWCRRLSERAAMKWTSVTSQAFK